MTGVIKVDDIQDAGANSIVSSNGSGTLTLGSFTAPNITASTAILPDASDGAAIGSASLEFSDLFLADGAVINLGDDQDVTLTHVADTGIQLNSTNKLMFNDASQYIQGASATVLDIAATDEIELTATLVDINANVEISGTAVTTGVHTFTAVPVFPNNTVESADIQADAITGAKIADDAINSEHYTDGSIDTAHIADDQITAAKINNDIISGTTALAAIPATTDEFLISDAGTLKRIDAQFFQNTPAFSAYANADQNGLTDDTYTKLAMNAEFYDTDGKYNTSNYRFTPTVAGKYNIGACVYIEGSANFITVNLALYKNGSQLFYVSENVDSLSGNTINATIELDSDDYVELYAKADVESGGTWNLNKDGDTANNRCFWFGHKLIGA